MKKIIYGITALFIVLGLSGCTARIFDIHLKYETTETNNKIIVKDQRLDKQIYMTGIGWDTSSNIYFLKANPSIDEVIRNIVSDNLNNKIRLLESIEINIEELDLKNKVGFGQADELFCKIESTIKLSTELEKKSTYTVKTFSVNKTNMSPFINTSAKVILDQCLYQHSIDLVNKIILYRE